MMNKYDVVIVGGGTAGVACAFTSGKLGLKTLLVESNTFLGGTITSSLVIPAMKTSENAINTDFFNVLYICILRNLCLLQDYKYLLLHFLVKVCSNILHSSL